MKKFSCVIIVLFAVVKACESFENFDESPWIEINSRDKYFEYSDLSAPAVNLDENKYNEDVNSVELSVTTARVSHALKCSD